MAKNAVIEKDSILTIAVPVPVGTNAGAVVAVGTGGLRGFVQTNRATSALRATGEVAQGLKDGEASVSMLGISLIVVLTLATVAAQFAPIYLAADGSYTNVVTGNVKIGFAREAITAPGQCEVLLLPSA